MDSVGSVDCWWGRVVFFLNDSSSQAVEEKVAIDSIMSSPIVDVNAPTSALAFLDQFYKGEYENEDYIKKHATANVVNKLKRDCDYSDDCLATWVFLLSLLELI